MMRILFQTRCPICILLLIVCAFTLLSACNGHSYTSPEGYDLRKPERNELGKTLNEISGLTYNEEGKSLLAISDSKRKIFEIDLQSKKLKDRVEKFWEQADFEDIVKIGNTAFVLISDGTIVEIPLTGDSTNRISHPFWSEDKNDFETLYYDQAENALIIVCKSCKVDKGKGVTSAYRFDLTGKKFDSSVFFSISDESVRAMLKNNNPAFKPSAAAIHPIEKRLYILASAGQLIVITDTKGKVVDAYHLNPDMHPQAEGIAFAPNGTMFISNEGKYGKPTLQIFPYNGKSAGDKK